MVRNGIIDPEFYFPKHKKSCHLTNRHRHQKVGLSLEPFGMIRFLTAPKELLNYEFQA